MARPARSASRCAHEELHLERVGVIVVDALALLERQVGLRAVVVVLLDEDADAGRQRLEHGAGDGGLAGAGAAGDAEHEGRPGTLIAAALRQCSPLPSAVGEPTRRRAAPGPRSGP